MATEQRQLLFNSEALTNLLVVDLREKEASTAIRKIAAMLLVFGRYMEQTLGYSVDYNILETADSYIYQLIPSYVRTACWIACSFTQRTVVIT